MGSLAPYRARRRFGETPEPRGKQSPSRGPLRFVVQKHDATRLHYDFRLEWRGVLLSWAVTRGPSDDPREKRLAVRTEDHPLDYARFEGVIPEGNYGAGTVMLWDRGIWTPLHDPAEGLEQGKLHFTLSGARMRGGWALVRMRPRKEGRGRRNGGRENWLLVKDRDAEAGDDPDRLTGTALTSVATGRDLAAIAAGEPAAVTAKGGRRAAAARKKPAPAHVPPQLATLVGSAPEGEGWWHEVKFDGYRGQISLGREGVRIYNRSGLDWSDRFAPLLPAAGRLGCDSALIDGEVMAGEGGFSALQAALKTGGALVFYAFDLLHLDGRDLRARPLSARREALEALMAPLPIKGPLRLSPVVTAGGPEVLGEICAAGGEGIVSKRAGAPYRSGRGRAWLKVKCRRQAEFVIVGHQPSDKPGRAFRSLLLASWEKGRLTYRGKVGTGFGDAAFRELSAAFEGREVKRRPLDVPAAEARGARWLKPELVAEIRFAEYTADGRVRHAVFLGLREDKPAAEVAAEGAERMEEADGGAIAGITITSPGRAVFPRRPKVTKRALALYYEAAAERMLPHLKDRPLALLRYPDGIAGKGFFQKHRGDGFPAAIRSATDADGDDFMFVDSAEGIVGAVQMGTVEFHIRGARRDALDRPDRMVFDLDPDPSVTFPALRQAARDLGDALEGVGLPSQPMVTGGKGIHLVVPLRRTAPAEAVTGFARAFATVMAEREPGRFTATMSKKARRGRIFIDWLRNQPEATAVCPWVVRARPGARVAAPVGRDDLDELRSPRDFGMEAALARTEPPPVAAVPLTAAMVERLEGLGSG